MHDILMPCWTQLLFYVVFRAHFTAERERAMHLESFACPIGWQQVPADNYGITVGMGEPGISNFSASSPMVKT